MTQPSAYKLRCYEQGKAWVAGDSRHNEVDDECCLDFSCCEPSLFGFSRERRLTIFNKWAARNELPQLQDA